MSPTITPNANPRSDCAKVLSFQDPALRLAVGLPPPAFEGGDGPMGGALSGAAAGDAVVVSLGAAVTGALAVSADAGGVELGGVDAGALGPVLVSLTPWH